MKKQIPLTPVLGLGLVIVLVVAFVVVVQPKRAESARLDAEIAELETKVALGSRPAPKKPPVKIDVADIFRLAKAMPDGDDMPGIILELNSIASSAGVRFVAIQPAAPTASGSYRALPINLTFEGSYYDLTDFLYRLRNLVTVKDGVLDATGRLYTLDAIDMHESKEKGFPQIEAVVTISAYAFGPGSAAATSTTGAPPSGATQTTTGGTTTTPTTTTGTQTTPTETTSGTSTTPPPASPPPPGSSEAMGGNG